MCGVRRVGHRRKGVADLHGGVGRVKCGHVGVVGAKRVAGGYGSVGVVSIADDAEVMHVVAQGIPGVCGYALVGNCRPPLIARSTLRWPLAVVGDDCGPNIVCESLKYLLA